MRKCGRPTGAPLADSSVAILISRSCRRRRLRSSHRWRAFGPVCLTVFVAIGALASACASNSEEPATSDGAHAREVSQIEFGEAWPFTVNSGVLRCHGTAGTGAVTLEADGTVYAVNEVARARGYADLRRVWENDSHTGAMKDLGLVIERGLELCG